MTRLIIAGSRGFDPDRIAKSGLAPDMTIDQINSVVRRFLFLTIDTAYTSLALGLADRTIEKVVSGGAVGVDTYGEQWARQEGIPVRRFLPEYEKFKNKRAAPLARNVEMAAHGTALIAISLGESTGTAHMMRVARDHGLPVAAIHVPDETLSRVLRYSTHFFLAT